jgi:hypothetical protein
VRNESSDQDLDRFLAQEIAGVKGIPGYTANITKAWQIVEIMMRKYFCELKLDVFIGVSGDLWVASFYSPAKGRRFEGKGRTAPLAICRAARDTYMKLFKE